MVHDCSSRIHHSLRSGTLLILACGLQNLTGWVGVTDRCDHPKEAAGRAKAVRCAGADAGGAELASPHHNHHSHSHHHHHSQPPALHRGSRERRRSSASSDGGGGGGNAAEARPAAVDHELLAREAPGLVVAQDLRHAGAADAAAVAEVRLKP